MHLEDCREFLINTARRLLAADSPSGFTQQAAAVVAQIAEELGYPVRRTNKGNVILSVRGRERGKTVGLCAHIDTLGLMVRAVKPDGRLAFTCLGGPSLQAVETENVTVINRGGQRYTGVVELRNASKHVNRELDSEKRDDTTLEILLDEEVSSREDVERLGIAVGDIVCLDPRARVTESGFIRSRFLDDKLSAGMLLTLARGVAEGTVRLSRKVTLFFSVYEEVGHGASCGLPEDTEDLLVVDMGCVGDGLTCTEREVSICAKDSGGPYNYAVTTALVEAAKSVGAKYAVDVYPHYGSDVEASLRSGWDVRHGLIGAGVYASHGYERSHIEGVENTLKLLEAYVLD